LLLLKLSSNIKFLSNKALNAECSKIILEKSTDSQLNILYERSNELWNNLPTCSTIWNTYIKKTNLKARNCKLQRRFPKKCEDSECLPTVLRGIPKIAEKIRWSHEDFRRFKNGNKNFRTTSRIQKFKALIDNKLLSESCDYRDNYFPCKSNCILLYIRYCWTYCTNKCHLNDTSKFVYPLDTKRLGF